MPSEGRRLHGFTVVSRALSLGRQLLLPAILGGASVGGGAGSIATWILGILTLPSIGLAIAQWLAFRFRLEGDELIIDTGVFSRRRRVIPLARIQNIDLEQSIVERLVGVAQLRLETASGGRETEASLQVLSLQEARALQQELIRRRATGGRGEDPGLPGGVQPEAMAEESGEVLLRLSTADLALAGATSNEAGLIAAGLATLLEVASDIGGLDYVSRWVESLFEQGLQLGAAGAALAVGGMVVALVAVGWLLSVVATILRYHGFTLTRVGTDLRREYGLISRHHATVPLERVQAVRIEETWLRRIFGLAAVKIETAGAAPGQGRQEQGGGAEAFVPIARRREVASLLPHVFEDARFSGLELHSVAPVSRRRSFLRLAAPITVAAIALTLFLGRSWLPALLLLVPAWWYARAEYRARAWARPEGFAVARSGVFTRLTWVVPERKVQTVHLRETPFQRRWELATLLVDTAAGGRVARVVDLPRSVATELLRGLAPGRTSARARSPAAATKP